MKYLAETMVRYIMNETSIQADTLRFVLPSYSSDLLWRIGTMLEESFIRNAERRIEFKYGIAYRLGKEWQDSGTEEDKSRYASFNRKGWHNAGNNLTSLRNQIKSPGYDCLVTLLAGYEHIDDRASLQDFFHLDQQVVWEICLRKSFESWLNLCLENNISLEDNRKEIQLIGELLKALYSYGLSDLAGISSYLESCDFSAVTNGDEAYRLILSNLVDFNLPNMSGLPRGLTRKGYSSLFTAAREFFKYGMFLEASARQKYMRRIEAFEQKGNYSPDEEQLGQFSSLNDLLAALKKYIANNSESAASQLRTADFIFILEKIINYKEKKESVNNAKARKVQGVPPEVFLRALWLTLGDFKKNIKGGGTLVAEELRTVTLRSLLFRHDFNDDENGDAKLEAQRFLLQALGGIDDFLQQRLELKLGENDYEVPVKIASFLCPGENNDELAYRASSTAEPFLRFEIVVGSENAGTMRREFQWMLPQNHPSRLLVDMYRWAKTEYSDSGDALPVFAVPYLAEVFKARDEEEINRLLNTALQNESCVMLDLLKTPGIDHGDPLRSILGELSRAYQQFLQGVEKHGFFYALDQRYDSLRQLYSQACNSYLDYNRISTLGSLLLKAFMIVPEKVKKIAGWSWERFLEAGIVTPLHPALLDMIRHQHGYLCEGFSYYIRQGLESSNDRMLAERHWDRLLDLSRMQWPIFGTLIDANQVLDTNVWSYDYIHLVGQCQEESSFLNTRLLLEYDDEEDDEIADAELFRDTQASQLIKQVMLDYRRLYSFAEDGLSIAAFCGREIQPLIAGIDAYLDDVLSDYGKRLYSLRLTLFSDSRDDSAVMRWINAWKDRWQVAELAPGARHYENCRISVSYRVIPHTSGQEFLKRLLDRSSLDLMFFMDFMETNASHFMPLEDDSWISDSYRKFPVLEKMCCRTIGGGQEHKRQRVLSNYRFRQASLHAEVMACLKGNTDPGQKHAVISESNFEPWLQTVAAAHKQSAWVVCIDPGVDEQLLKLSGPEGSRDIIGFGTGVGAHGENNYTISTEQFTMVDIKERISSQISVLLNPLHQELAGGIADSLMREAINIAGLSLIKATGPDRFVREFIGNAMARKLLLRDQDAFCDAIVSLDAFMHWFADGDDKKRPDLLRLQAHIADGFFRIKAQLIECKLAHQADGFLEKARQQIENGLRRLVMCFRPQEDQEPEGINDKTPPDQRYWWMQLHRLIASKGESSWAKYNGSLLALERLSEGLFDIDWQAVVVAFWTDSESDVLNLSEWDFQLEGQDMMITVATAGKGFINKACLQDNNDHINFGNKSLGFRAFIAEKPESAIDMGNRETEKKVETKKEHLAETGENKMRPVDEGIKKNDAPEKGKNDLPHASIDGQPSRTDLKRIPERILLGKASGTNREVYWEFGHPELQNRHILIFGASGTGKTYTIQTILYELGKSGQNSMIVDYTNGFTTGQLEPLIVENLKPKQHWIRKEPLTINPFRRQIYTIDEMELEDMPTDVAERVTGVFAEVYNLGDQQKTALYTAIGEGVAREGDTFNLRGLLSRLDNIGADGGPTANSAISVISKLQPFVDTNPFGQEDVESWEKFFTDTASRCHILQLAGFTKDTQRLINEFSLFDLYWYYRAKGKQDKPRVIVLDEIQNLDQRLDSPLGKILPEGRKFGISLVLATQTLSNLGKDERDRLFQASHKLFFKPADTEIRTFAQILADATGNKLDEWVGRLTALKRGECYSLGYARNESTGKLDVNRVFKINIRSLEERI